MFVLLKLNDKNEMQIAVFHYKKEIIAVIELNYNIHNLYMHMFM